MFTTLASCRRGAASAVRCFATSPTPSYERFFSRAALRRRQSPIRELQPLVALPDMISLGGGMPNVDTFPYQQLTVTLKDGAQLHIDGQALNASLQYSPTYGMPRLLTQIEAIQAHHHGKAAAQYQICVGNGSQDLLEKAFWAFCNEEDSVLVEAPCYSGALAALDGVGARLIDCDCDAHGLDTSKLEHKLDNWQPTAPKPKLLYCIPSGQNPSGATLSLQRRQHLLEIANKHDLLIMEDDPYYHLQFCQPEDQLPSLWSLDTQARVLRFDSFSKVLSAGVRMGFVSGPVELVEKIQLHQQASLLHASGVSQIIVAETLQHWGIEGWLKHLETTRDEYWRRRDTFIALCEKYLSEFCTWSSPEAGMFVWFRVNGCDDTRNLIKEKAVEKKVLLVPGVAFSPQRTPSPFVRAAFSTATEEQMKVAVQRFAQLCEENKSQ